MKDRVLWTPEVQKELEQVPQSMLILYHRKSQMKCVLVTDLLCESLRMTRGELSVYLRRLDLPYVHPQDKAEFLRCLRDARDNPEHFYDIRLRIRLSPDGSYQWYSGTVRCRRLPAEGLEKRQEPGRPVNKTDLADNSAGGSDSSESLLYISIPALIPVKNMNYRKSRENRMHELLFDKVLSTTRDCIFWKDVNRRFVGVNQAFLDFYGFDSEEVLLGKTDEEMHWHPDPEPFREDELRVLQGESTVLVHGTCLIRGEVRDILASKSPIYDGDKIIGLVGSFIDVTDDYQRRDEIEKLYEELKAALENEKAANTNLNNFMSRLSHELRTPMNAIIGLSNLGMNADALQTAVDYFHKINVSGQYLLGIINDVLDVNKSDAGKLTLHEEPAALEDIAEAAVTIVRPLADADAGGKGVDLRLNTDGTEDCFVWCDRQRVQQILVNLLNNAIKFTDRGGQVSLSVQQSPVRTENPSGDFSAEKSSTRAEDSSEQPGFCEVTCKVQDTGCGMSREFMDKLFTPFAQENRSPSKYGMGTGLGLVISRTLARQMGGDIVAHSEEGKGSLFTVTLRLRRCTKEEASAFASDKTEPALDESVLRGKRVLLVEDNELNREVGIGVLSQAGMEVECASDGLDAVHIFEASEPYHYDLILMDLQMPRMDGYDSTVAIRALPREDASKVPIIAMTADVMEESMEKARTAGMNDYITKPYEIEQLVRIIANMAAVRQSS